MADTAAPLQSPALTDRPYTLASHWSIFSLPPPHVIHLSLLCPARQHVINVASEGFNLSWVNCEMASFIHMRESKSFYKDPKVRLEFHEIL
jgi:hypothetical protein